MRIVSISILIACLSVTCATSPSSSSFNGKEEVNNRIPYFPFLSFSNSVADTPINSPVSGTLIETAKDERGTDVAIIRYSTTYFFDGKEQTALLDVLIGGLKQVTADLGSINEGDTLGIMTNSPYIAARSSELDPFWLRMSSKQAVWKNNFWWFSPDWILSTVISVLSYRPVLSLEAAVDDFYQRWAQEHQEKVGATLHFFPALDRVRVKFALDEYPEKADRSSSLLLTEGSFYKKTGIFTLQNFVDLPTEYDVMLYWQNRFDEYLKNEYKLGSPIWLYCNILTLDHDRNLILVCVSEFALTANETIVEERKRAASKTRGK